jgi:hypothetical protein
MIHRLAEQIGSLTYGAPKEIGPGVLERDAVFCYEGTFIDMDGNKVKVTAEKLRRLAENHNAKYQLALAQAVAAGKSEIDPADAPPLQVDHSTSGWDTVGRIFGMLRLVDGYVPRPGAKPVVALAGPARFLGEDNCERARDGRWATLSTAADFDEGYFTELTVTPFPAAKSAKLLSEGKSKGDAMDPKEKEKLKRHLTECKKMSAEDADKHLASASEEDCKKMSAEADDEDKKRLAAEKDEADKKLAAEKDEKEKDEKKLAAENAGKVTRLAAAKPGFAKLAKEMRTGFRASRLESRKAGIVNRLASLRSKAKITPAEIKKLDVEKLSAKSDVELDAFFEGYDAREEVVLLGQKGSAKAEPVARLATQQKRMNSKQERLSSMPFTAKAVGSKYGVEVNEYGDVKPQKLADGGAPAYQPAQGGGHAEPDGDERMRHLNSRFAEACKFMDEGKREDAMRHLKDWMMSLHGGGAGDLPSEAQARMSALAEHNKKLENQFEELVKMVAPVLEVGDADLA